MKSYRLTIQMKAEQYFPALLFIMLYKVVVTFEFVDEILNVIIQMKAQCFSVVFFIVLHNFNTIKDIHEKLLTLIFFHKTFAAAIL